MKYIAISDNAEVEPTNNREHECLLLLTIEQAKAMVASLYSAIATAKAGAS